MKKLLLFVGVLAMLGLSTVTVNAEVNAVTPSTNDINRTNGWAHVNQTGVSVGEVTLEFIQPRAFAACFEYRTDGDTSQASGNNYNPLVTDGLYPFYCQNNNSSTHTILADEYVEVRMVFGAESDERFDWTRFDVLYPRTAEITSPEVNQDVYGEVEFTAYLDDDDQDSVQWAVREGTCAAGTNTVFGNVDGKSDSATIDSSELSNQTFSFTADMSSLTPGMYCFIYNPTEDSGESNIRETVEFNLIENPPTDKNECKKGGWEGFMNWLFKNQGDCVSYVQSNENASGNRKDN